MKQFFLLFFIGSTSFLFGQAPDGFPSTFTANGDGNWNGAIWTKLSGSDPNGPDGDDYVIISNKSVTVTANAGFGHLEYSASGNNEPILTINSGISLVGYTTVEDGSITFVASGGKITAPTKTLTCNIEGTVTCLLLTMETTTSVGNTVCNLKNGGTLTIQDDLTLISASVDTDVRLDATTGSVNVLNLGGSLIGPIGVEGVIDMGNGAGVSTFNFNGTAPQTIEMGDASDFRYSDIQVSNTDNASIGLSAVSATNVTGDITVSVGAVFDDNALSNVFIGDIINLGTINASGSIDLSGNFTNSGTFTSAGCNINIAGNWNNTGTYTYFSGDNVIFNGGGISTITGATDWYELTVDKPISLTVSSGAQNIHGILDLDQGTFTSGGLVTLISDATSTGQMDDIGTATFSGDLTVQRRVAKTAQSFLSLGSPVSGTTLAAWSDDNIIYTGDGVGSFTGADFETFGWHNTYWYDEGAANGVMNNGFTKATATSQSVGASNDYKAFHIYTDAVTYNLDVTGAPNTGAVNIPLQYDGSFAGNQAGWNLIANPYPCTIDWESIHGGALGTLIDGYFVYNDGLSNYDYYDGGVNAGLVAATQFIPHTQGFWVRSTGLTTLAITEADKNTTDQAFYKSSSTNLMRIGLAGSVNAFGDAAVLIEGSSYTANYDTEADVQKFTTLDPDNAPSLYTVTPDGYAVCFNKIPSVSVSIPLVAKAGTIAQGDYTLNFDIPANFMLGACITLEDLHTGMTTDLRADTFYTYATSDTTTLPRFIIHIVKDFNTQVLDYTCFGTSDGTVTIDGSGITGSTFELLDGTGSVVFSGAAANDSIEFTNVPAGGYEVFTNHLGSCSVDSFFISVIEPAQVIANFELVEDTVYLSQGGFLEVNNMSSATNYTWDFDDGNTSIDENPTHVYAAPGVYQVMLSADNDNVGQCTEVTSRNVIVMNGPLAIDDMQLEENSNAFVNNGKVVVDFDLENNSSVEITLVDVTGKIIISNEHTISSGRIALINTDEVSNGVYFVNIIIEGQRKSQKLFID